MLKLQTLKKYLIVHFLLFRNCLLSQLEYRFNFISGALVDLVFLFDKIIYALIVNGLNLSINGMSPDEVLLFIGSYSIILGLYCAFFLVNINITIPNSVKNGDLDILITKPISTRFYISVSYVEFATMLPDLIGGIVIVIVACIRLHIKITAYRILGYLLFTLTSVMTIYSFYFIIQMITFYVVETSSLGAILNTLVDMNTIPYRAYGKVFRFILVYIFPILLFGNISPLFLLGQLDKLLAAWSIFVPVTLFIIGQFVWKKLIKRYTSVNS